MVKINLDAKLQFLFHICKDLTIFYTSIYKKNNTFAADFI